MQPTAKTVQKLSNKIVVWGLDRSIEEMADVEGSIWISVSHKYVQFFSNKLSIRFADWLLILDKR